MQKILIVDDAPENIMVLGERLMERFQVLAATSGEEALAVAKAQIPALILLDVKMPGMDGHEVLARLKADPVTSDIPVIFVTADNSAKGESDALRSGAADFVHKPVNLDVLESRLRLQLALKEQERTVRESKERLEIALEAGAMGIWEYEIDSRLFRVTQRHSHLLGLPEGDSPIGFKDVRHLIHRGDRLACLENLQTTRREDAPFDQVYRALSVDGGIRWMHSQGKLTRNERGEPDRIIGTTRDISALMEHQHQLERMANYDPLTSLPNRVLLVDRLCRAMAAVKRQRQRLALIYIDLDGFKAVNDEHGHAAGDKLLITVSHRMKQALRECDTLARLGGDEFAALVVGLDDENACLTYAGRLLRAAAEPVALDDATVQVTASIGVAFYPQPEEVESDDLLLLADRAMYEAKESGKNRCHLA